MRVGFLVWNRCQVGRFAEISRHFDEPDFIFIDRDPEGLNGFDPIWLTQYGAYTRFIKETQLASLDGEYDAILTHFTPALKRPWVHTKLVMCQYSMAEATSDNARWFAADRGLVYGSFSDELISKMCPTAQCGDPRFDPLFEDRLDPDVLARVQASLDPHKKTILCLSAWADVNSRPRFHAALSHLTQRYNVIVQPHQLTLPRDTSTAVSLGEGIINADTLGPVLDIGPYLMSVADVVLSDMSGALFDALYCGRGVVLLGDGIAFESHPTVSEITARASIGPRVTHPDQLGEAVELVLNNNPFSAANEQLAQRCFLRRGDCARLAADAVRAACVEGTTERSRLQSYTGVHVRDAALRHTLTLAEERSVPDERGASMADVLQMFRRVLPQRFHTASLRHLGRVAYKCGATGIGDTFYLSAALSGGLDETMRLAEASEQDGRVRCALRLYKMAAPSSLEALGEYLRLAQKMGHVFDLGLAVEAWLTQTIGTRTRTFYRHAAAASQIRFSRARWRTAFQHINTRWLNGTDPSLLGQKINTLHSMGFVDTARAIAHATGRAEKKCGSTTDRLGTLSSVLEAAAQNELAPMSERVCFEGNGSGYAPVRIAEVNPLRLFEMVTLLNLARKGPDISKGLRQGTIEFTRHCMDALLSLGFSVLPRLQIGYCGAVPILGRYPSMTWHSIASGVPGQIHVKVGTYNGHIVIDKGGYGGWASIATVPLATLIAHVDPQAAERQWRHLHASIVEQGLSKFLQADEAAPSVKDYVFLPMQLLDDTVAEHADINSLDLLHELAAWHKSSGRAVVAKRHPRCKFKAVADALERYSAEGSIIVSNASIHDLIANAACVVTVNSGVGAEALLHLKPVITTGGSDYAAATRRVRTRDHLRQVLDARDWIAASEDDIKKFLWVYTKCFMPHFSDKDAIHARLEELIGANTARAA